MTTFKEVFDTKINQQQIKQSVIKKRKRQQIVQRTLFMCCVFILLVPLVSKLNINSLENPPLHGFNNPTIRINEFEGMGLTKLDIDAKIIPTIDLSQHYEFIQKLNLDQIYTLDSYALYVKESKDAKEYNILDSYVLYYTNEQQHIRIAFSETNEPIRDYYVSRERPATTIFNEIECIFYQYEDIFMVTFQYNNIYFDIETSDVEIEEVIQLVKTILE